MLTSGKVMIDTNIVSYLMRGGPEAVACEPHVQGKLVSISFITVGELYYGAEWAKWGQKRKSQLETTLRNFVVVPYEHEIAKCYGSLAAERKRLGRPIDSSDAWIAACALRHGIPLVTHNAKHFEEIPNLKVIHEQIQT